MVDISDLCLWHEGHIMILTFSVAFYNIAMEFGLRLINILAYWHFKMGFLMAFLHDTMVLGIWLDWLHGKAWSAVTLIRTGAVL
jgi:hypothetical protein